ncbi:hypothetical protein AAHA92_23357 [Salvia divinorum]|uniref:Uncharacterized protein n=1 Tax=Salvia divinorum TaxID=28513 RepID=A0ABD1GRP6_SALDI
MCKNPQMNHKYSSPDDSVADDAREDQMHSCWGRFMLVFSRSRNQRKLKNSSNSNNSSCFISFPFSKSKERGKQSDAFRYSPLSYAQNFDDGIEWEADDQDFRGFSSRYAAPPPSNLDLC